MNEIQKMALAMFELEKMKEEMKEEKKKRESEEESRRIKAWVLKEEKMRKQQLKEEEEERRKQEEERKEQRRLKEERKKREAPYWKEYRHKEKLALKYSKVGFERIREAWKKDKKERFIKREFVQSVSGLGDFVDFYKPHIRPEK